MSVLAEETRAADALRLGTEVASTRERRTATFVIVVCVLGALVGVAFARAAWPSAAPFGTIFGGVSTTLDLLSAAILFGLYRVVGRRAVLAAAAAYLGCAAIAAPYTLAFPAFPTAAGLIGNDQTAPWLWIFWHATFPVLVTIGLLQPSRATTVARRRRNIRLAMALTLCGAAALIALATAGGGLLPPLTAGTRFLPSVRITIVAEGLLTAIALVTLLMRGRPHSTLQLWLVVAMTAALLDSTLNLVAPARFAVAWYVGKLETLVTSGAVLLSLIFGWSSLYARATELAERLAHVIADRRDLRERFEREHSIAETLQRASLAREVPKFDGAVLSAVYRPAVRDLEIGGDWYDAFLLDDGRLALTLGDVSGKGLAASVVMGRVRQTLRVAASVDPDPYAMLRLADRALRADDEDALVTAFVAVVDRRTGAIAYASAGHPPPLVFRADGRIDELAETGLPLGLRRDDDPRATNGSLAPGDVLVAYTDGLVEVTHDLLAGTRRLRETLALASVRDAPDPATALYERIVGTAARDDVAIVTLALTGDAGRTSTWRFDTAASAQATSARRTIAATLGAAGASPDLVASAQLAFGELVGNAVRYAPGPVEVRLEIEATRAVLHVLDSGAPPAPDGAAPSDRKPPATSEMALPADPLAESGRGLFIVRACATSFDLLPRPEGGSHAVATFALAAAP